MERKAWDDFTLTPPELMAEKLLSRKVTGMHDYSLPMSDVLHCIATSLNLEIERAGRVVKFKQL